MSIKNEHLLLRYCQFLLLIWFALRVRAGYVTLSLPNRAVAMPMADRVGVRV
jgi:hypothetical protein